LILIRYEAFNNNDSLLYEAFNNNDSFEISSQTTTEQYFFIGILGCVFGSWYMLHQDIITQLERNSLEHVSKSLVAKNLIFFLAFVFTYMCINIVFSGVISDANKYRNFAVTRSVLCIVGWLISCYRFVVTRNNNTVRHDE